jgi:hypothetical protein
MFSNHVHKIITLPTLVIRIPSLEILLFCQHNSTGGGNLELRQLYVRYTMRGKSNNNLINHKQLSFENNKNRSIFNLNFPFIDVFFLCRVFLLKVMTSSSIFLNSNLYLFFIVLIGLLTVNMTV